MQERRRFERFSISLPVRMEIEASGKKQAFEFKTKDISASGAFIDSTSPISKGTRLKLNLTGQSIKIKELTGAQSLIECEGIVMRSTAQGTAVCFDKECQIYSLKSL